MTIIILNLCMMINMQISAVDDARDVQMRPLSRAAQQGLFAMRADAAMPAISRRTTQEKEYAIYRKNSARDGRQ
jgi:hypothetical protein